MPRKPISIQPCCIASRLMSSIASRSSGVITGVNVQKSAATSVPARLASKHDRPHARRAPEFCAFGSAITGSTTVIVFSVKSCWRASTTMTKPIG